MWKAKEKHFDGGKKIQIYRGDAAIPFAEYLELLESDQEFRSWYSGVLSDVAFDAFFWEHPPIRSSNLDMTAEFVLLDSPALASLSPDPKPFDSYFSEDAEIVSFRSLGGDAILVAPTPSEPLAACAHLAAFLRLAPASQVDSLWSETGREVRQALGDRNLWLSTSGLGVSWLHVRLDAYPKYYQHRPYAESR